jgi:hypothetical protein
VLELILLDKTLIVAKLELRPFDNINSAALAVVASDSIAFVLAVILAVFDARLFVSVNSAALALVASDAIAFALAIIAELFVAILIVLEATDVFKLPIAVVLVAMLVVLVVILFESANSAALAVAASKAIAEVISKTFAFRLILLDKLVVSTVIVVPPLEKLYLKS